MDRFRCLHPLVALNVSCRAVVLVRALVLVLGADPLRGACQVIHKGLDLRRCSAASTNIARLESSHAWGRRSIDTCIRMIPGMAREGVCHG